jgi:radical SAM superfamily enzyme YgiQ (UPF0313 family)
MRYEGTVYRPPSEARSLIVQVTVGCSWNRCRFCTMYKDKKFRVRSTEDVMRDFQEARARYGDGIGKIFLADGDALVLPADRLAELLTRIGELFPHAKITAYGSPSNILRKSPEELSALRNSGLSMIYVGAESGDDQVLRDIDKGVTRNEIIAAGQKLKAAGIPVSMTLISGLGGRERLTEHAVGSADLVSSVRPEYVGFLTLLAEPEAPICRDIRDGKLSLLDPEETAREMELFLRHVDSEGTIFRANHASNYLILRGTLNRDIPAMLGEIEAARNDGAFRHEYWRSL